MNSSQPIRTLALKEGARTYAQQAKYFQTAKCQFSTRQTTILSSNNQMHSRPIFVKVKAFVALQISLFPKVNVIFHTDMSGGFVKPRKEVTDIS